MAIHGDRGIEMFYNTFEFSVAGYYNHCSPFFFFFFFFCFLKFRYDGLMSCNEHPKLCLSLMSSPNLVI